SSATRAWGRRVGRSHAVIARSEATKQSILSLRPYGLLRFARNDGEKIVHELRLPLCLWHADARLLSSDGEAVVAQRGLYRRGAVPGPAPSGEALSRAGVVRRPR